MIRRRRIPENFDALTSARLRDGIYSRTSSLFVILAQELLPQQKLVTDGRTRALHLLNQTAQHLVENHFHWGNPRQVLSRCDNWLRFPDLSGAPRIVTRAEWGNGDIRAHHVWWMRHFPHFAGSSDGISWNWWEYVIDPNKVKS